MTAEVASEDDRRQIKELLGREPMGVFTVAVRDASGRPVVIENAPLLDDGTPMPTRFWLVGATESHAIATLEADGGVRRAEAAIAPDDIEATHRRHAAARDALIPDDHEGPRPTGGVGGTRTGVKCLHAHYACHLAGEDDAVGEWVAQRLSEVRLTVGAQSTNVTIAGRISELPTGIDDITQRISHRDPPDPADLTNAIGVVTDQLDDLLLRADIERQSISGLVIDGRPGTAMAVLETGLAVTESTEVDRATLEELFRLLATDDASGRASQPGLVADDAPIVLATAIIGVAVSRRLRVDRIRLGDDTTRSVRT